MDRVYIGAIELCTFPGIKILIIGYSWWFWSCGLNTPVLKQLLWYKFHSLIAGGKSPCLPLFLKECFSTVILNFLPPCQEPYIFNQPRIGLTSKILPMCIDLRRSECKFAFQGGGVQELHFDLVLSKYQLWAKDT